MTISGGGRMDPMTLFRQWRRLAGERGLSHPDAVCVSTVDSSGAPHARFVDLKAARNDGFVFCTSYLSPKSAHIEANPRVSLTFWWDHVGRQVRVRGSATRLSETESEVFFRARSRDAQLANWAFKQSAPVDELGPRAQLEAARERFASGEVPRPQHWGGYLVDPVQMEFLTFHVTRVHWRLVYERQEGAWVAFEVQP